ncbi:SMP-30/gluconolactonase/LRE family protein [Limnobacter litoralis]|uniref:SMP-30/Gluconolactonase/LRE-like region domain-containing protein n=1 Tax=Limnobacter litoralis TaxID=481366 RepID=A0ABQ5YKE8_9BURK|nr:SMP-30/gluconolactonase/LRE family protein [Limnobacter litoralis]GLR25010.1 hypothetical protein GCM10007875_00970 [Limnobacter litoralis]
MNTIALWIAGLLGIVFGVRAVSKLLKAKQTRRWGLGLLEMLGSIAAFLSVTQPFFVFFVAVLLSLLSFATTLTQRLRALSGGTAMAVLTLLGSLALGALQPFGLKVLLLPKAEALAADPVVSSRIVKTFAPGEWLESVQIDPNGHLFVSVNEGENYMTGDKSKVRARVLEIGPAGQERTVLTMPPGTTVGMITFDQQGHLFVNSQGRVRGVWQISEDSKGRLLAELPNGSWPNGLTTGPDGKLYVADSSLGTVWRINPENGKVSAAIEDKQLKSRPYIALAPGANGLQFYGNTLYVTVSDSATVQSFNLQGDGTFSSAKVFAKGIPGDDFAIDHAGSLYVTTHPFNTIVRINQQGQRRVIATAREHIIGATSAAFGKGAMADGTLYVATDGGAFSGDQAARGTLVALQLR